MQGIMLFLTTYIYVVVVDLIWLGFIANGLYVQSLGSLLKKTNDVFTPNWLAASVVYIAMTAGVIFFVLPRVRDGYVDAFIWGAVFGLLTYAIYNFTNYAILANWTLRISLLDCCWGAILYGLTSTFAMYIKNLQS